MFKKHIFSNTVHCRSSMPRLSQTLRFLQSPSFRQAQSALIGQLTRKYNAFPLSRALAFKINVKTVNNCMVTHTWNSCSASTHSSEYTHTHTHTHTCSGQPFMLRHPGSSWGFDALLKGTSLVVLKMERVLYIHSPH